MSRHEHKFLPDEHGDDYCEVCGNSPTTCELIDLNDRIAELEAKSAQQTKSFEAQWFLHKEATEKRESIITHQSVEIAGQKKWARQLEEDRNYWRLAHDKLAENFSQQSLRHTHEVTTLREQLKRMPVLYGYVSFDTAHHLRNYLTLSLEVRVFPIASKDAPEINVMAPAVAVYLEPLIEKDPTTKNGDETWSDCHE
jgi:hypothetical protein